MRWQWTIMTNICYEQSTIHFILLIRSHVYWSIPSTHPLTAVSMGTPRMLIILDNRLLFTIIIDYKNIHHYVIVIGIGITIYLL